MKQLLKIILCFVLLFSSTLVTSCSKDNTDENENTANKEYYTGIGYHSVTFDKYTQIVCDDENKIVISNSEIMIPNNTEISLEFNHSTNTDFKMSNDNFVNFNDGLVLSGFNVEDKFYEVNEAHFKVKSDLNISAKLNKFKTVGIAVYAIDNLLFQPEVQTGKIDSITIVDQNPLYFFAESISPNGFNESNLITNTEISTSVTALENNKFKVNVFMAIFVETIEVKINLILSDEESNIYLFEDSYDGKFWNTPISIKNLSNKNSNLDEFILTLGIDINDEYEPF